MKPYLWCLGKISKDFTVVNIKNRVELTSFDYLLIVICNTTDISDTRNIICI